MKKLFTIALAFVLTCALAACGCQAQEPAPTTTIATTAPVTTVPTTTVTVPSMDPTTATNIHDPEVDSNSTEMTEEYTEDVTIDVMPTDSTDTTGARSRMGR